MTTQDALLADILAKPDDDLPRLVYADWLDENGQGERAEFIRVQVELAKPYDAHADTYWRGQLDMPADVARRVELRRRERELWQIFGGPVVCPTMIDGWRIEAAFDAGGNVSPQLIRPGNHITEEVVVRRGFVAEVRCRIADWCGDECHQCAGTGRSFPIDGPSIPCRRCDGSLVTGIGPRVVRRHPVERVVLTDRQPGERNGLWFWYFDSGESGLPSLPTTLNGGRQEQRCYESERAAVDDASRRVIAWAKARVASEVAVV